MRNTDQRYCLSAVALLALASAVQAQDKFTDPDATMKTYFWGDVYKSGGTTLYCDKTFSRKSVLFTEGYVFPTGTIRDQLHCGSSRQCESDNDDYRRMVSDLHNIYPADARFELKRKNAFFEEVGDGVAPSECDMKISFQIMEPPDNIKGNIARALLYMHTSYQLPLPTPLDQLQRWNKIDPPDDSEIKRNQRISELQGNDNPFITNPAIADLLTQ